MTEKDTEKEKATGVEAEKQGSTETIDFKKLAEKEALEAKENYHKWLYSQAELENFKKRTHKEKLTLIRYGHEHFARELLGVADSLEQALHHVRQEKGAIQLEEGVQLTLKQLLNTFTQFGIVSIESLGKKFDPHFHQADAEEFSEAHEPETIIRENRKGYLLYDRVLRAAHVTVANQSLVKKET